jgi:hypothetical protein
MIITHTLKIDYHTGPGGHIHEFYVALGSHDIETMKEVIGRAEQKAESLAGVLANARVKLIDPQA